MRTEGLHGQPEGGFAVLYGVNQHVADFAVFEIPELGLHFAFQGDGDFRALGDRIAQEEEILAVLHAMEVKHLVVVDADFGGHALQHGLLEHLQPVVHMEALAGDEHRLAALIVRVDEQFLPFFLFRRSYTAGGRRRRPCRPGRRTSRGCPWWTP